MVDNKIPEHFAKKFKKCNKCGWEWISDLDREPKVCPKCKSYEWNSGEND